MNADRDWQEGVAYTANGSMCTAQQLECQEHWSRMHRFKGFSSSSHLKYAQSEASSLRLLTQPEQHTAHTPWQAQPSSSALPPRADEVATATASFTCSRENRLPARRHGGLQTAGMSLLGGSVAWEHQRMREGTWSNSKAARPSPWLRASRRAAGRACPGMSSTHLRKA